MKPNYQICTSSSQLSDLDKKGPVMLAGESVVTFVNSKKAELEKSYKEYVKQPTAQHKSSIFSKESVYSAYFIQPKIVQELKGRTVHLAIDEVIRWGYKKARINPNIIIINSFVSGYTVHSDVLIFTDGVLVNIDEIRGLPTNSSAYTRMLVDEIMKRKTEQLRYHSVMLTGNANHFDVSQNASPDGCALDRNILNEINGRFEAYGMAPFVSQHNNFNNLNPFVGPKKLVLISHVEESTSPLVISAITAGVIIASGLVALISTNMFKKSEFQTLLDDYDQIVGNAADEAQNQSLLQIWQLRDSFVREKENASLESDKLELILKAISTASRALPEFKITVRVIKHDADSNSFSIDVGARAKDFESSLRVGKVLFSELAGSMSDFSSGVIGKGAPRRQMIDGVPYFVFTFTGEYLESFKK